MPSTRENHESSAIVDRILTLRGQRVLLDASLAQLYGISTKRFNEQIRRNVNRFPTDFSFELTRDEVASLRLQNASSNWGGRRYLPTAFTEHGAISVATLDARTRRQFEEVYGAIRALMAPPAAKKRPIGFMADIDGDR